jgi:hypothetical protein
MVAGAPADWHARPAQERIGNMQHYTTRNVPDGRGHRSRRRAGRAELRAEIRQLEQLVAGLVDDLQPEDQAGLAGDPRLGEAYTIWKQREGRHDA